MVIENQQDKKFDCIKEFVKQFGNSYASSFLEIPSILGKGFIKRTVIDHPRALLYFRFIYFMSSDKNYLSTVQVMNFLDLNDYISPNTNVFYAVACIKSDILLNLLDLEQTDEELNSFISNFSKPFLYQEVVTSGMKVTLRELSEHTIEEKLERFYYKTKVSELIYEFFSVFFKRATYNFTSINKADIEKILSVEKMILNDLGKTPVLPELARSIGMCETKMKSLFKKVFGNSIYNYYSSARMIEAASLLKNDENISVSEVGYSLGFSNLSHFSKRFSKHIGMKPKEYAMKYSKSL